MAPRAGGQCHYVTDCAPPEWQRFLSYCSGWISTISWQAIVAVDCYIIGGIIQALIVVNHPGYNPTNWAETLLIILTILLVSAFNTFAASHLSFTEGVFATCHVFAFVPICVTFWVMVSPKIPPAEVFVRFRDDTGTWGSTGLSVLVGQIASAFTTIRCDAVANLAEEVEDDGTIVSQGMLWSFLFNLPLTFVMFLTYAFNIGSVHEALRAPYPFIYAFQNALPWENATAAFAILILVLLEMIAVSTMAATSRQTFAFAYVYLAYSKFCTNMCRSRDIDLPWS